MPTSAINAKLLQSQLQSGQKEVVSDFQYQGHVVDFGRGNCVVIKEGGGKGNGIRHDERLQGCNRQINKTFIT